MDVKYCKECKNSLKFCDSIFCLMNNKIIAKYPLSQKSIRCNHFAEKVFEK